MELGAEGLDVAAVARIAAGLESLTVSTQVSGIVESGHRTATRLVGEQPVYGRSTGVGANRSVNVQDPDAQLSRVLRSHATSSGPDRSPQRVRAMVAVRIAQLAQGASGISPAAFEGLIEGLASDRLPSVQEGGSIGTGDLSALATVGVWLLDHPGGPRVRPGDGLALISSNAGALGDACLALRDLADLADAAVVVASLTMRAVHGNLEAFSVGAERATPFRGAQLVCERMRGLLRDDAYEPARIQDPFGLRTMPQVHGVLLDALHEADRIVTRSINTASENPLLSERAGVAHHGGFHAAYLAHALEGMSSALAGAAQGSFGRTTMLSDPRFSGHPAFLADGTPGASGTMIVEYAAASSLARLRSSAVPASTQTVSLSLGLEEDASFAAQSAQDLLHGVSFVRQVVGAELLGAARALAMSGRLPSWPELESLRPHLVDVEDHDLSEALGVAAEVVATLAGLSRPANVSGVAPPV